MVDHGLVRDIAVGENDEVDVLVAAEPLEITFGDDRDRIVVQRARGLGGIEAIGDARDLCGREGHDLHVRIVSVDDVEVMEVAPCGAHDDHSPAVLCGLLSSLPNDIARGVANTLTVVCRTSVDECPSACGRVPLGADLGPYLRESGVYALSGQDDAHMRAWVTTRML